MARRILLFAPAAFNLAETTRMLEIAKGVRNHDTASKTFEIQFISDGGDLERLIEEEGFLLQRMSPRLTKEKIEHIAEVDRGERFAPAFSSSELFERVESEVAHLRLVRPAVVITGSYLTIPVSCRILNIPLAPSVPTSLRQFSSLN
ncbi:MAG: hypothetical protein ABSD75_34240 [Terriglobales bacterium]|jgi:hypothetical protein